VSKATSEVQPLENDPHDCPMEEKENETRKELDVLDKGDNLSNPNAIQVSPSLSLEYLSIHILFIIRGWEENKNLRLHVPYKSY